MEERTLEVCQGAKGDHGQKKPPPLASGGATSDSVPPRTPLTQVCYSWQKPGHICRDFPQQSRRQEASGRTQTASSSSRTAALGTQCRTEEIPTSEL